MYFDKEEKSVASNQTHKLGDGTETRTSFQYINTERNFLSLYYHPTITKLEE